MEFEEFDRLVEKLRIRAAKIAAEDFQLIEGRIASIDELAQAEQALGATLPVTYKSFMTRYGGGLFGFVDLLPVHASQTSKDRDDIVSVSRIEFPNGDAVALAPVGTGDFWCFRVINGNCGEEVWFHFHDGVSQNWPQATSWNLWRCKVSGPESIAHLNLPRLHCRIARFPSSNTALRTEQHGPAAGTGLRHRRFSLCAQSSGSLTTTSC